VKSDGKEEIFTTEAQEGLSGYFGRFQVNTFSVSLCLCGEKRPEK
jgi:hypothetical protein